MKSVLKKVTPLLVVFTVLASSHFIDAAWLAPAGSPSASNNAPAPLNVSTTNQMKLGDITALHLKAGSQMWSNEYCDSNGENCFTNADIMNVLNGTSDSSSTGGSGTTCTTQTIEVENCQNLPQCPSGYTAVGGSYTTAQQCGEDGWGWAQSCQRNVCTAN